MREHQTLWIRGKRSVPFETDIMRKVRQESFLEFVFDACFIRDAYINKSKQYSTRKQCLRGCIVADSAVRNQHSELRQIHYIVAGQLIRQISSKLPQQLIVVRHLENFIKLGSYFIKPHTTSLVSHTESYSPTRSNTTISLAVTIFVRCSNSTAYRRSFGTPIYSPRESN